MNFTAENGCNPNRYANALSRPTFHDMIYRLGMLILC
jgi:hypothetical protein